MTKKALFSSPVTSLLILFAVLHIIVTLTIFSAGFYKILPTIFDGKGALSGEGSDVLYYWDEFPKIKENLEQNNFPLLTSPREQIHIRVYSLSYVALYPLFGDSILSLEGVNIILYLLMLFLTYKIGEKCFDSKTGILAAVIVGLLPSLLIHTSQPLRDPLFIVLMLGFTGVLFTLLEKGLTLLKAIMLAIEGILLLGLLWLVRDSATLIYLAMIGICLVLLLLKSFKIAEKKELVYNFACLLVLLAGIISIPKFLQNYLPEKRDATPEQNRLLDEFTVRQNSDNGLKFVKQIQYSRFKAGILYSEAGSNIDQDTQLSNLSDVILYLPRAFEIGAFAPFPYSWIDNGKILGQKARMLAGIETIFTYLLYLCAAIGVWKTRASPKTWLLVITFLIAATSFGLVIINVGALYRLRYFFWILAVILGAGGINSLVKKRSRNLSEKAI